MLSNRLAPLLDRWGIHYAWVVMAATFLTMVSTAAAMGNLGVLLMPVQKEFGWDTGSISGALALRLLLFGLLAPFAAALMQRYGLRAVVAAALALISLGLGLSTLMTRLWHVWATWGLLVGVGTGLTAMVLGATVANRWFSKSRGLVVGLLTASSATGQLAFLPLAAWVGETFGWRVAIVPVLAACALACCLMLLFARDRPSDLGLPAYGEAAVAPPPPPPAANPFATALAVLGSAARTPAFWILFGSFFVCGLSTNGLIQTHFIPLCFDFGMGNVEAASVLAMIGEIDFLGTVLYGWLSDRYDNRKLLAWYYGLRGISLLFLPMSTFTFYGLSVFAVFYGLDWIATVPPTVKLTDGQLCLNHGPLVFGWVFTGHQIGAAVAALGAGLSRDAFATYLPAFYTAGAACLLAAMGVLMIRSSGGRPIVIKPVAA